MEPRAAIHRSGALLLLAAVLAAAVSFASTIGDKCSACKAVAAELEIGISSEKPRNHLDLRNRLNSKGQREGKVIDYRYTTSTITHIVNVEKDAYWKNMLRGTILDLTLKMEHHK